MARPWFWQYFGMHWFGVVLVWFGFGLIQIAHLRLPFNSQGLPKSFWYPACQCRQTFWQNYGLRYIFGFSLVWFFIILLSRFWMPWLRGFHDTSGSSKRLTPPEISRGSWKQHTLVILITSYFKFLRRKRMLFNYFPHPLLSFGGIGV